MTSGQSYKIRLVVHSWKAVHPRPNEPSAHIAELCFKPETNDDLAIQEAVSAAQESDVSVVFAGRNSQHEGEGSDMEDMSLPGNQAALINAVAAASKKTIVVLHSGSPLDVSKFVDSVDSIIYANYLGQEGGAVIADIIYGKVNPSGKLPTTWPRSVEDTPTFNMFPATKDAAGKIELSLDEGLNFGYRHNWDQAALRYPFGYGLSYTKFQLSDLSVEPSKVGIVDEKTIATVTVNLANVGTVAGAEVIQVYVGPIGPPDKTVKVLKGFSKVYLEPGASQPQKIPLDLRRALSYWDTDAQSWVVKKGVYGIHVAGLEDSEAIITVDDDVKWIGL